MHTDWQWMPSAGFWRVKFDIYTVVAVRVSDAVEYGSTQHLLLNSRVRSQDGCEDAVQECDDDKEYSQETRKPVNSIFSS